MMAGHDSNSAFPSVTMNNQVDVAVPITPSAVCGPQGDFESTVSPMNASKAVNDETPSFTAQIHPTFILYLSVIGVLFGPFQFGWSLSQLNLSTYHNEADCGADPIVDGTCIMFPGHTPGQWTILVNAWIIGGMCGSLMSGTPAAKYGRKRVICGNGLIMIIGALVQAFSTNLWIFGVGRFIAGLASGCALAVTASYLNEISPPHLRGTLGSALQLALVTGILCVACSFFFTNTSLGWRLVGGFPGLLGAVQVALSCIVMVESPAWLIEKGRIEEASKVLARLFGEQYVTLALTWYQPSSSTNIAPPSVIVDDITEEDAKKVLPTSFANGPQGIKLLFSRMYLHQICVGTGIAMMQQFTGVNAIFYYSSSIFRHAGVEDDRIGGVIINIFSVLPTFGVLWIIKKYPKRKILLTGTTAMFLIALGLTIAMVTRVQVLSIIFTAMYVAAFSMSTGPLTWPLIAELFPDHVRSRAMAVASCSNWISNLIIGISFPLIANALGSYGFLPFMIALIISFIFIYTSIPETNGKTTDEIQAFFQRTTEESVA